MKKLISIIISIFIFAFAFVGCDLKNSSETESDLTSQNSSADGRTMMENFSQIVAKECTMNIDILTSNGEIEVSSTMFLTSRGEDYFLDTESLGQKASVLYIAGDMYIIDNFLEVYVNTDSIDSAPSNYLFADDYSSPLSSGIKEFEGKEYYYEEYSIKGVSNFCFFKNNLPFAIISSNGEAKQVTRISNFSDKADTSKFKFPKKYKEKTPEEYAELIQTVIGR